MDGPAVLRFSFRFDETIAKWMMKDNLERRSIRVDYIGL